MRYVFKSAQRTADFIEYWQFDDDAEEMMITHNKRKVADCWHLTQAIQLLSSYEQLNGMEWRQVSS